MRRSVLNKRSSALQPTNLRSTKDHTKGRSGGLDQYQATESTQNGATLPRRRDCVPSVFLQRAVKGSTESFHQAKRHLKHRKISSNNYTASSGLK